MQVIIDKRSKRRVPKGKRRFDVTVIFPRNSDPNIFTIFVVDKKYELLDFLGGGSSGLVCSAIDTSNNEMVAIKKIDSIFENEAQTQRVMREVLIHSQINHPFIVAFKEIMRPISEHNVDDIYTVIEMVHENLERSIIRRRSQPDEGSSHQSAAPLNVQLIMNQLLRALNYLHSANVLHRDLKPQNILITENQTIKICDFGLARIQARGMSHKVITREYRPPELFLRHMGIRCNYGPAVEIWSLGCTFADMLLQRPLSLGFANAIRDIDVLTNIVQTIPPPDDGDLSEMIGDEQTRRFVRTHLPPTPSRPLRDILVDVEDNRAMDLLEKMLVFNPRKRITAADALQHEYMAEITVEALTEKLNLNPDQVERLQDSTPPRMEVFEQNPCQLTKPDVWKILLDRCANSSSSSVNVKRSYSVRTLVKRFANCVANIQNLD